MTKPLKEILTPAEHARMQSGLSLLGLILAEMYPPSGPPHRLEVDEKNPDWQCFQRLRQIADSVRP